MSATKRGKQKQQAEVSEEEDFQTFVRESLGQLSKGQKQIIQDISNLKAFSCCQTSTLGAPLKYKKPKQAFRRAMSSFEFISLPANLFACSET